jgi:hypothetical protein
VGGRGLPVFLLTSLADRLLELTAFHQAKQGITCVQPGLGAARDGQFV